MNIEHKISDDDEIIPRNDTYRTAFFNDRAELLITLALIVITFVLALARATDRHNTFNTMYNGGYITYDEEGNVKRHSVGFTPLALSGVVGFGSAAAFVIFFRGKKFTYQTSKDKFTVFRGKKSSDVFYYSEITSIISTERSFFGVRRGFTVTVVSGLKTKSYRVICPKHIIFESSVFSELEKNMRLWQKNRENDKIRLQNPSI